MFSGQIQWHAQRSPGENEVDMFKKQGGGHHGCTDGDKGHWREMRGRLQSQDVGGLADCKKALNVIFHVIRKLELFQAGEGQNLIYVF